MRSQLSEHLDTEELAVAELVLSEIVTNAVLHGECDVTTVEVTLAQDRLEVSVTDRGAELPVQESTERPAGHGGLGLQLVADLCDGWGVLAHEDGKRVWARLGRTRSSGDAERITHQRSVSS